MADMYGEGFDAGFVKGRRRGHKDFTQLIEAVKDTIFMFMQIEKARQLPGFADAQKQYVMMGRELKRALAAVENITGIVQDVKKEGE